MDQVCADDRNALGYLNSSLVKSQNPKRSLGNDGCIFPVGKETSGANGRESCANFSAKVGFLAREGCMTSASTCLSIWMDR